VPQETSETSFFISPQKYTLVLQVFQLDTSFPTVNCATAVVWPISLVNITQLKDNKEWKQNYGGWYYHYIAPIAQISASSRIQNTELAESCSTTSFYLHVLWENSVFSDVTMWRHMLSDSKPVERMKKKIEARGHLP
jgi:hypothetical protein